MRSKLLEKDKFKIRKETYKDAVSYKFDNRRVTVSNIEDERDKDFGTYIIETRNIVKGEEAKENILFRKENVRGDLMVSTIKLSREAAEALLLSLSEMLNKE